MSAYQKEKAQDDFRYDRKPLVLDYCQFSEECLNYATLAVLFSLDDPEAKALLVCDEHKDEALGQAGDAL